MVLPGKDLETLAAYLVQTLRSVKVSWDVPTRSGQIDVVLRDEGSEKEARPWSGEYVFIECKDRGERVDVSALGAFSSKLSGAKVKTGIVLSREGLTGRGQRKYAEDFRNLIFNETGIAIMSIRISELHKLRSGRDFLELLRHKYEEVKFGTRRRRRKKARKKGT